jgi:CheY-like chemotaxis protein
MNPATAHAGDVHDADLHEISSVAVPSYVLIVDDETAVRDYLKRCLDGAGYAVKLAANAAEALEVMMTAPAAVVLCDVRMPGQDGLWLTERLHAHWPTTAIVMATAIDDMQTINQSRALGAVDYISKPIRPDQLIEVVRRATARTVEDKPILEDPRAETRPNQEKMEAEYALEAPVRCPACGERISSLKAVRLIRAQVNFTSTLPRRGRVLACPCCLAIVPAELTNF